MNIQSSTELAMYTFEERIEKNTWRAVAKLTEKDVLIFSLPDPIFCEDKSFFESLKELHHPNLLSPNEILNEPSKLFVVVTTYVAGSSFTEFLSQRRQLKSGSPILNLEEIAQFIENVSSALKYLHDQKIFFANLSLDHIWIEAASGKALLKSWEIKQYALESQPIVANYLAPEQIMQETLSPKTDQYSLAALVYELLTGIPPFGLVSPDLVSLLRMQTTNAITPPSWQVRDLPVGLDSCIAKALRFSPEKRFKNLEDFSQTLLKLLSKGESKLTAPEPQFIISEHTKRNRTVPRWLPYLLALLPGIVTLVAVLFLTTLPQHLSAPPYLTKVPLGTETALPSPTGTNTVNEIAVLVSEENPDAIRSLAFSPDGTTLAVASANGIVQLWDIKGRKELKTLRGHTKIVTEVSFSSDGKFLASSSDDTTIIIWDLQTGVIKNTLTSDSVVLSVAFSPDGKNIAAGYQDNTLKIWNWQNGENIATINAHSGWVWKVVYSPNGKILASTSFDSQTKLWNAENFQLLATLEGHNGTVWSAAFSPDGQTLATGGDDKVIRLWEVNSGQLKGILSGHTDSIRTLVFYNNGKMLASGSHDRTIRLWDMANLQLKANLVSHTNIVTSVAFSSQTRLLASGSEDRTIKLWALKD